VTAVLRPPWRGLVLHIGLAVALLVVLRPVFPATVAGLTWGVVLGFVLYLGLAGGAVGSRVAPAERATQPTVAVSLFAVVVVGAAAEEVVWRLGLLGALTGLFGTVAGGQLFALAAATVLFASAHVRAQGRRGFSTHLVTGSAFGAAYLLTHNVAAAAVAHAAYNVLVAAAPRPTGSPTVLARAWAPLPAVSGSFPVPAEVCARLAGVRKRYGRTVALDGLDLEVRRGEILCLLGPNGAGKSTAVALLLGLRRPDEGTVELFGGRPSEVGVRRRLGATPQEAAYPPALRVREIVTLAAAHFESPEPVDQLLDRFGLGELAGRQVGGLSGGQRRRLAVALAFAGRPELVVLDEPTAGLDIEARQALWAAVRTFAAEGGSVLFTTHHLDEAELLASRIVLLARGRVATTGSIAEIRAEVGLVRLVLPLQSLPPLPTLVRREDAGGRTTLVVRDVGAAVRALVAVDADLSALEVRPLGLEEVFRSLTKEESG
jgi:ABC-2 type transport system ATP-binding protein